MSVRPRQARIFAALLVSMTAGAIVLMALGSNPPSAGAFCLSKYNHLDPVEKVLYSQTTQYPSSWKRIVIQYNDSKNGNINKLTSQYEASVPDDTNCHFIVCNGSCGRDGQIISTENWQKQSSIIPNQTSFDRGTILIRVMADNKTTQPTDFQIKRIEELVELLCREFEIRPESVCYPTNW